MMRRALALLLLVSCGGSPKSPVGTPIPAPPAPAPTPVASSTSMIKRVVVSLTRKSGTCITTFNPDGTITSALDVLVNGRGPKVDATLELAADGTIASLSAKGHHTMGTKVDELFKADVTHAKWKSIEEQGDKDLSGPAFFIPMSEIPDAIGFLVRALQRAGGTMPLLPGGTATLEKTTDATVNGRHVQGYAIVGLELTPTHVWMYDDNTWFGVVSPWWSIVPEGFESAIEPLIAKQNEYDRARDQKLAKQHAHKPPAAGLAYTHARVLDVEKGKWIPDQTVVVVGDKIVSVGKGKPPKDSEVIDLAGKALIPGLWDMHAHIGDVDGVLNIASGVTTVRDVGNDPDKLDDYLKRYDSGEAIGPHVYRMGFIEGRNEKAASSKVTAETPEEAHAAVEYYAKRKYDGIKIYNSVKPELVPILAKDAHDKGMAVTGHIPVHMLAHEAVKAGYDGIEHINMLFLNFFATHETDTRDTTRFTLVGEKAGAFDLKSKPVTDFIALLKEHKTVIDPTVNAFEDLFMGQQGKITPGLEAIAARLPVQTRRGLLTGGLPMEGKVELYKAAYDKLLAMTKLLFEQKIRVVLGTDNLAGLMLHHEMMLFSRAGISNADILRIGTIESARVMRAEKTSGTIAPGKLADLVVIDGDPLAKLDDITKVVSTVRGGVVYPSAPLYAAAGIK
jgi:imidazolonepropionase-like amidohydrolase